MTELNLETRADLETELSRMKPEKLDPPKATSNLFLKITMVVLLVLVFLLGISIGQANAQEDDGLCGTPTDMQSAMENAGFSKHMLGLTEDETAIMVIWVNPAENYWMLHVLDLESGIECHIDGGPQYEVLPGGRGA